MAACFLPLIPVIQTWIEWQRIRSFGSTCSGSRGAQRPVKGNSREIQGKDWGDPGDNRASKANSPNRNTV